MADQSRIPPGIGVNFPKGRNFVLLQGQPPFGSFCRYSVGTSLSKFFFCPRTKVHRTNSNQAPERHPPQFRRIPSCGNWTARLRGRVPPNGSTYPNLTGRKDSKDVSRPAAPGGTGTWRRVPDSNRCTRICNPLRNHSANSPKGPTEVGCISRERK